MQRILLTVVALLLVSFKAAGADIGPELGLDEAVLTPSLVSTSPAVASDGDGYLVIWQDYDNSTIPGAFDLYGARISHDGQLLDPRGMVISRSSATSGICPGIGSFSLSFDGTNYIAVWRVAAKSASGEIYAARIAPDGTVLDPGDLAIKIAEDAYETPSVACGDGACFIVWIGGHAQIYGTRLSGDGTLLDTTAKRYADTAKPITSQPSVAFGGGSFLLLWHDTRNDLVPEDTDYRIDIYGTRVSFDGTELDSAGILVVAAPAQFDKEKAIAFDGENFMLAWWNAFPSYEVRVTRIANDGTVLDPAGILVDAGGGAPAIAFDDTDYLVAWWDGDLDDVRGARVTSAGEVLDPDGITISAAPNQQYGPHLACNGTDCLAVWDDNRNDLISWDGVDYQDIYGARVAPAGTPIDTDGILISISDHGTRYPAAAGDGQNYLVVWEDTLRGPSDADYNDSFDIHGALVGSDGTILDPDGFAISTAEYAQRYPAVAFDGINYLVAWADSRGEGSSLYASRVSPGGLVLDPDGIKIAGTIDAGPVVACNGNVCLVVWEGSVMESNGPNDWVSHPVILGMRISPDGTLLDPEGITICAQSVTTSFPRNPTVASNGTDFLVAWEDSHYTYNGAGEIYGSRISTAGTVLDPAGLAIGVADQAQLTPAVASDGESYLVIWFDGRNTGTTDNSDIYGARVLSDGNTLDPQGISISRGANKQYEPAVTFDGINYVVLWSDARSGRDTDIYAQAVSPDGTLVEEVMAISVDQRTEEAPTAASDGKGTTLMAYRHYHVGDDGEAYGLGARFRYDIKTTPDDDALLGTDDGGITPNGDSDEFVLDEPTVIDTDMAHPTGSTGCSCALIL